MTDLPDWFTVHAPRFDAHLDVLRGCDGTRALQIGAYTGDASVWLLDRILTGTGASLTDVDPWTGSRDEVIHDALDWRDVWATYRRRMRGRNVTPYRMTSDEYFDLIGPGPRFDFVYIDGDHHSEQVYRDGVNADVHLRVDGILAFDDYHWYGHNDPPHIGIDRFLDEHGGRYHLLEKEVQVWLRKVSEA